MNKMIFYFILYRCKHRFTIFGLWLHCNASLETLLSMSSSSHSSLNETAIDIPYENLKDSASQGYKLKCKAKHPLMEHPTKCHRCYGPSPKHIPIYLEIGTTMGVKYSGSPRLWSYGKGLESEGLSFNLCVALLPHPCP